MPKKILKSLLSSLLPSIAQRIEAFRIRRHINKFERSVGLPKLQATYLAACGNTVQSGPFQGLNYLPYACGSTHVPKLLGSYEKELHSVILKSLSRKPKQVIDVGAAEGYYAVGYAMRLPEASVIAYDTDRNAQKACGELARLNGVSERVRIDGACSAATLAPILRPGTLLFCDCEGFEYSLFADLDPEIIVAVDIIIELHKSPTTDPGAWFNSKFSASHDVTLIHAKDRNLTESELETIVNWPDPEKLLAVNEFRNDGLNWGYARSRVW